MKRKYQLIIIVIVGFILSLGLYFGLNSNNTKYAVALGDSIFVDNKIPVLNEYEAINNDYIIDNISSYEMYTLLVKNTAINNRTIQKIIYDADAVFIGLGTQELRQGNNAKVYLYNMEKIILAIKKINANQNIYLVGVDLGGNINYSLKMLAKKHNIVYINPYN